MHVEEKVITKQIYDIFINPSDLTGTEHWSLHQRINLLRNYSSFL